MKKAALFFALLLLCLTVRAQVPQIINYQGRMTVGGVNFNGNGQFKFALVNGAGTVLWSNSALISGQPGAFVVLPVTNGIYSVFLGDTTLGNMAVVPSSVFAGSDVRLRIWFNNGAIGFQQLSPDQRIGAVGYAIMADGVKDGAITSSKLAAGAVTSTAIAGGAVTSAALASGAVTGSAIANGAVGSSQLAAGAVTGASIADGTITTGKIANGAVTASQIADHSIGTAKLFKQYDGGKVNIYDYDLATFPTGKDIPLLFAAPFNTSPSVSFGAEGADSAFLQSLRLTAKSKSTTGFTMGIDGMARPDTAVFPINAVELSSRGVVSKSVTAVNLLTVSSGPAIAYIEGGRLIYRRALDRQGNNWNTAQTLDLTTDAGTRLQLTLQNGNPAIAYSTGAGALYFIRATDATGTAWGPRGTVAASGVKSRVVAGSAGTLPAMVAYDVASKRLQFYRATDAAGTAWVAPVALTATTNVRKDHWDFTTVSGQPAVVFSKEAAFGNGELLYLRSTAANGSTWPTTTVSIESPADPGYARNNPRFLTFNGTPFIFFARASHAGGIGGTSTIDGTVVATHATGTTGEPSGVAGELPWTRPELVVQSQGESRGVPGEAGLTLSVGIVGDVPMVLSTRERNRLDPNLNPNTALHPSIHEEILSLYQAGTDGTGWNLAADFGTASDKRPLGSLQSSNNIPCWASCTTNEATLISVEAGELVSHGLPAPQGTVAQSNGGLGALTLPSGKPLLAFFDSGDKTLKVTTSADTYGLSWNAPITVGAVGGGLYLSADGDGYAHNYGNIIYTGPYGSSRLPVTSLGSVSLGSVQSFPSIAYVAGSPQTVFFIRATSYDGLNWGAASTVATGSGASIYSDDTQLLIANGNPAIFYLQGQTIKFARATNVTGTAWGAAVSVVTDANLQPGFRAQLIGGNPAVVYGTSSGTNFQVKFVRATDTSGTTWPAATLAQTVAGYVASTFHSLALAEIGGTPAVALHFTVTGKLTYTRSTVVAGTSGWSAPVQLDSAVGLDSGIRGRTIELLPAAKPVIVYEAQDAAEEADLRCVVAADATGTTWGTPATLLSDGNVGQYVSASVTEAGLFTVCYDATRDLTIRLKSVDGGQNWTIVDQGHQFPAGEHFCATMAGANPAVLFQMDTSLYESRAIDPEGATWGPALLVQSKFAGSPAGPGVGFYPSATVIGGRLCVSYYDADNGNLEFKRAGNDAGGAWSASVNIVATDDVGGYSSLADVNGRPAVCYYNFTNKTLHFKRATDAVGGGWGTAVTVAPAGNGEYCQLTNLGGLPAILFYDSNGQQLMLARALDVNGAAWGTPSVVDDGLTTVPGTTNSAGYTSAPTQNKADVGRFAKLAFVGGKLSIVYTDSTNKDLLYKRATDANGTAWGARTVLAATGDAGLFPTITALGNLPSVFHLDRTRNSIRNLLPTLPFSVSWTAVEP